MKSDRRQLSFLALGLGGALAALACGPAVRAGAAEAGAARAPAARPAPAATPKGPKQPKTKKKSIFDEEPDPRYERGDRVDPFTLGKPKLIENGENGGNGGNGNGHPPPPRDFWKKKLRGTGKHYRQTELLLSSERKDGFSRCLAECQKYVPPLKGDIRELRKKPEAAAKYLQAFRAMLEKFQRLEVTAKRLQHRQEVEADFGSKKITVEGIVWKKEGSHVAAVNGEMVTEGSVLRLRGGRGGIIQVYRIRKGEVVFLYRGIQVSTKLQRGSL